MICRYWHVNELWPRRRQNISCAQCFQYGNRINSLLSCLLFGRSHGELIESLKKHFHITLSFFTHFSDTVSNANSIRKHIWVAAHTFSLPLSPSRTHSSHALASRSFILHTCWPQLCRLLLVWLCDLPGMFLVNVFWGFFFSERLNSSVPLIWSCETVSQQDTLINESSSYSWNKLSN